jgi:catechol 2,3-dioxygenase-like lactoylglutathione lyase family enzyme
VMKKLLIVLFIFPAFTQPLFSQSKLGEVACVYITTPDLDSSVAFYEKLGFPKIASNTFPVPWAQVSDGSLLIMMRKDATPYMGLTYYVSDIETVVGQLEKDGIVFTQKPKEGDAIKRYYFKSPDGFNIMLASNLGGFTQPHGLNLMTMDQKDYNSADKYPNKQCGAFGEFCHPVKDLDKSIAFWEKLGFKSATKMNEPYPHAILSDGLMIIGLHQTDHFNYPAITYFGINTEKRIQLLRERGLKNLSEMAGKNNQVLNTWEGQHFFIFSLFM